MSTNAHTKKFQFSIFSWRSLRFGGEYGFDAITLDSCLQLYSERITKLFLEKHGRCGMVAENNVAIIMGRKDELSQ
ncbi:MAG: hypothetical protein AAFV93_14370, partial [Chloroflexota bacterium]